MKLNGPRFNRFASRPIAMFIRGWMRTVRYRIWHEDELNDPALHSCRPRIYIFWHENILMPLHLRGNCHVTMLLSKHRDADILARIAGRFGFDCIRGSTYRGGVRALLAMADRGRSQHLTMTPDGPRGPRRKLAQGPIFLASKLGMPIVCVGMAYRKPWRLGSWDRFAIPKPFSRGRGILSADICVPPNLDRAGIEHWRKIVEQRLDDVTEEAQLWANSGAKRVGEKLVPEPKNSPPVLQSAEFEAKRRAA